MTTFYTVQEIAIFHFLCYIFFGHKEDKAIHLLLIANSLCPIVNVSANSMPSWVATILLVLSEIDQLL